MALQILIVMVVLVLCCLESTAAVIPLDRPGMGVRVEAGDYTVRGRTVHVPHQMELAVDAPEKDRIKGEEITLGDETPHSFVGGTVLKKTMGPVDIATRYPNAIDPASVIVRSADAEQSVYVENKDYFLDHEWGGLSRLDTGGILKDAKLRVDYAILRQRVDLVQVSSDGRVSIKKGKSAVANPEIPRPDTGWVALANIYVPFRTRSIEKSNIYPLPADDTTWRSLIRVRGREHLTNTLQRLRSKKPLTIVCWGDSVTQGGSPSSHDRCYVERFRSLLTAAYPGSAINLMNAGIGGSSTSSRRDGYDKEVLAHNPDLVTVEFVNDCWLSSDVIKANWAEFIDRARKKNPNVEFVLITPHMMLASLMAVFDKAVAAMRQAAEDNHVALADATSIWTGLRSVGIPYETLLANGINHPNDLGHEFFAESLMALLARQ